MFLCTDVCITSLQLLDLCILDINSLDYQYGVLAAAAFCHFTSIETVQKVSGEPFFIICFLYECKFFFILAVLLNHFV